VIGGDQHFPGWERDQDEAKGYYAALDEAERLAKRREKVSEANVKKAARSGHGRWQDAGEIHALSRRAKCDPRRPEIGNAGPQMAQVATNRLAREVEKPRSLSPVCRKDFLAAQAKTCRFRLTDSGG
jgi:hypothetical protein